MANIFLLCSYVCIWFGHSWKSLPHTNGQHEHGQGFEGTQTVFAHGVGYSPECAQWGQDHDHGHNLEQDL